MRRFRKRSGKREPLIWARNCFDNSIGLTGGGGGPLLTGCQFAQIQAADVIAEPNVIRIAPVDERWTCRGIRRAARIHGNVSNSALSKWMDVTVITVMTSDRELQNFVGTGAGTVEDVITGGPLGDGPWDVLGIKHFGAYSPWPVGTIGMGFDMGSNPAPGVIDASWDTRVARKLTADQVIADLWSFWPSSGTAIDDSFFATLHWSMITSVLWQRTMRK